MHAPLKVPILIAVWGVTSTLIAFLIGVICERIFKIPTVGEVGGLFPKRAQFTSPLVEQSSGD